MTSIKQLKEDISIFLLAISNSEEYKSLNSEAIKLGDSEDLNELTNKINNFLIKKIASTYPQEDQELLELGNIANIPFDRIPQIRNKAQRAQLRELLKYFIKSSKSEIKTWYEEEGFSYIKYKGIEALLKNLEAK